MNYLQLLFLITPFLGIWRVFLVNHATMQILNSIHIKSLEDIDNHREWKWRYEEFEKVSFLLIVLKFWKSPKSFFSEEIYK